ncbi:MAG: hypothetical protein C0497_01790 [Gemmatimonas sp.]|nr:hypothetical protein [Gemmatimonas sp.]
MSDGPLTRVLYIEDDLDIQAIATLALETVGGLTVQVCSSGHDAVAVATAFAPDCVLLDVMMPGMDGPATLEALRADVATARLPVVFMTAKVQPAEVEQLRALGAIGVIAKPFDPMSLAAELRAIFSGWQGR